MDEQAGACMPLAEAATQLGVTVDSLRKRVRRGQATARRGNDNRLSIWVPDQPAASQELADEDELADALATAERWRATAEERGIALAAAEAKLAERAVTLAELRAELAWHRRPLWRRLIGR